MKVCPKCGKQYPGDANFCPVDAGRLVDQDVPEASETDAASADDAASASEAPDAASGAGPEETPESLSGSAEEPAPAPASQGGEQIVGDRFELIARIGGAFTGEIFRATDKTNGRTCVVKRVDPAVFPTALALQRTERELRQLQRIKSAGITKIFAHGRDEEDRLWIAAEYVAESQSLHEIVFDGGPLDAARASKIVLEIGQSLADAAKVGVIHRDLAPKNILLGPKDSIKIINFGVVTPGSGKVQGVPEFVAPEMVEGKLVDQRANIYSLGAVYYYLVTGRPPFVGEPEEVFTAHRKGTVEAPSSYTELLPEAVDLVVLKALERASSKRFMTLRQFLNALEPLSRGEFDSTTVLAAKPMGRLGKKGKGKGKDRKLASTMLGGFGPAEQAEIDAAKNQGDKDPGASSASSSELPASEGDAGDTLQSPAAAAEAPSNATMKIGAVASEIAAKAAAESASDDDEGTADGVTATPEESAESAPSEATAGESGDSAGPAAPIDGTIKMGSASNLKRPASPKPGSGLTASPDDPPSRRVSQLAALTEGSETESQSAASRRSNRSEPGRTTPSSRDRKDADAPRGRKLKDKKSKKSKSKFRETLWFKKGELDSAAADAAKKNPSDAPDKADSVPLEERYTDDGTLTAGDEERFSLKTGGTEAMPAFKGDGPSRSQQVSDSEIIDELKRGRGKVYIAIVIGLLILGGIVAYAISHGGDAPGPGGDDAGDKATEGAPAAPGEPAPAPTPDP